MKKNYTSILVAGLALSILAGCENTPEESIIKEKGAGSIEKYESVEESENIESKLKEILGAPEHYNNSAYYEDGGLVIDTDADVILPDVNTIDTVSVSAKEVNQEMIDNVTQAFFEGDKIYNGWSYSKGTKDEIQQEITRLKKYKAEGNIDPYEYGKDEDGNLYYDIDAQIERYEQELQTASDEKKKEEVTPAFGLEYPTGEKGEDKYIMEDGFVGVVETDNGNYDYSISYALAPDITFQISRIRDGVDPQEFTAWQEGQYLMDAEENGYNNFSEDKIKSFINISYEEAEKIAKEKVEKLGWGLEMYNWDYALFFHGEGGITENNILDGGYLFHFVRKINGIPITYDDNYGGGLESMDSTLTPWSYERCNIIVGNSGIEKVEICNPYEIGKVQTGNVKLMSFDSIIKIYEQMMEVSNANIVQYEANRTYHITKIKLGYTRIYDPTTENDAGLLVPVWDFFGGFDAESRDYSCKDSGQHSNRSFMTINAIDGTVIDRSIGY